MKNVVIWPRGVDTEIFYPREENILELSRPVFSYTGRVAAEKNIKAFLDLDLPGSKLVIGDGPDLIKLKKQYKEVAFVGFKFGDELAAHISCSDVFVFPSLTDTFGIVMLEAMACGVPVAAFPVTGPIDVIENGVTGVMDNDLANAALQSLELNPDECIRYMKQFSWQRCAEIFARYLQPINSSLSGQLPEQNTCIENS